MQRSAPSRTSTTDRQTHGCPVCRATSKSDCKSPARDARRSASASISSSRRPRRRPPAARPARGPAARRDPPRRAARRDAAALDARSSPPSWAISRGVVVEAYAQLVAEGFLVARAGAADAGGERRAATSPVEPLERRPARPCASTSARWPPTCRRSRDAPWLAALRDALRDAPDAALSYGDRVGAPPLRATLAAYLGPCPRRRRRSPRDVVVCTGITQAIALLARALRRAGVAARRRSRTPAFPSHRMVLAREGLRVVPIPVDGDGLARRRRSTRPTSARCSSRRRTSTRSGWRSRRARAPRSSRGPSRARLGSSRTTTTASTASTAIRSARCRRSRPGRVIYLGTASKTLAPALRLGWVVVAPDLLEAVADAKALADAGSPQLDQLALARFIDRGELDRHLRRMRARLPPPARRAGRGAGAATARSSPIEGLPAGLHVCGAAARRRRARAAAGPGLAGRRRPLRLRARRRSRG